MNTKHNGDAVIHNTQITKYTDMVNNSLVQYNEFNIHTFGGDL